MKKEKKTKEQQNALIAQANSLVKARYAYSMWEHRIFIEMLQQIKREDAEFKPIRIYLTDILKEYKSKSNDDYRKVMNAAKALGRKVFWIDYIHPKTGEERQFSQPLVKIDMPKRLDDGHKKYIDLRFDDDVAPLFLKLKRDFFLFDKRNVMNFKSMYSFHFYKIIKQEERRNKNKIVFTRTVQELKIKLLIDANGNPTNKYKQFGEFEKNVIKKAQKDINKTSDIYFEYVKNKQGRGVVSITFTCYKRHEKKTKEVETETKQPAQELQLFETEQSEALQALTKVGIETDKALSLITTLGEEVALAELKNAQKALKSAYNVKSETGFIISLMEKQSYTKSQAIKKAEQNEKKKKTKAHTAEVEKQKKQIAELREEYTRERNKAVSVLLKDLDKTQVAELVDEYAKKKPLIQSAIKRAEEQGNKDEVNNFKFGLFVKDLKDESLHSFEKYLKRAYKYKLTYKGNDQFLVKIN